MIYDARQPITAREVMARQRVFKVMCMWEDVLFERAVFDPIWAKRDVGLSIAELEKK